MVDVNQNINQKMVFLNEEDLAENVKKFPVFYDKSNDEFRRKDKKCFDKSVYNKAANGTCSRDVSRTTVISEMEFFFVTIVGS